jgi:hypothetical protein
MSSDMQADLLRELPNDRPVAVRGMNGNTESMTFAREIHSFLSANGYRMVDSSATWHMFGDPPVFNVSINEGQGGRE